VNVPFSGERRQRNKAKGGSEKTGRKQSPKIIRNGEYKSKMNNRHFDSEINTKEHERLNEIKKKR